VGEGYVPLGTLKMRDMKMQDWKMRHKAAEGGKCRNGKTGKENNLAPCIQNAEPVRVPGSPPARDPGY